MLRLLSLFTNPLLKFTKRLKNTIGSVGVAEEIQKNSLEFQSQYSALAQEIHGRISQVFKSSKAEANLEAEKIINQAKEEASEVLGKNRKELDQRAVQLESELKEMKSSLVIAVNNKLLGKSWAN